MKPKHSKRDEPTAEELRDIPELSPDARHFGRGPAGLRNARAYFAAVRGRPKDGEKPVGTATRSLRLPLDAWAELERRAAEEGVSLHKLMRTILAQWLYTSVRSEPKREPKRRTRKSA